MTHNRQWQPSSSSSKHKKIKTEPKKKPKQMCLNACAQFKFKT